MKIMPFIALLCLPPALLGIHRALPANSAIEADDVCAASTGCPEHGDVTEAGSGRAIPPEQLRHFPDTQHYISHSGRETGGWTSAEIDELAAVIEILNDGADEVYDHLNAVVDDEVAARLAAGKYELVTQTPFYRSPAAISGGFFSDADGTKSVELFAGDSVDVDRSWEEYGDYVAAGEATLEQLVASFDR